MLSICALATFLSLMGSASALEPLVCMHYAPESYVQVPSPLDCTIANTMTPAAKATPLELAIFQDNTINYRTNGTLCKVVKQVTIFFSEHIWCPVPRVLIETTAGLHRSLCKHDQVPGVRIRRVAPQSWNLQDGECTHHQLAECVQHLRRNTSRGNDELFHDANIGLLPLWKRNAIVTCRIAGRMPFFGRIMHNERRSNFYLDSNSRSAVPIRVLEEVARSSVRPHLVERGQGVRPIILAQQLPDRRLWTEDRRDGSRIWHSTPFPDQAPSRRTERAHQLCHLQPVGRPVASK